MTNFDKNQSRSTAPLVKICGTTSPRDAICAADAGADYLGIIVEHPPSPRSVSLEQAVEIAASVSIPVVAVVVNLPLSRLLEIAGVLLPAAIQLHGDEDVEIVSALCAQKIAVWGVAAGVGEAVSQRAGVLLRAGSEAIVVDARAADSQTIVYGGTGHISDWSVARKLAQDGNRVILAGGLAPKNVARAIAEVRPWMVDVVSGVEFEKGRKDEREVRAFMAAVRNKNN